MSKSLDEYEKKKIDEFDHRNSANTNRHEILQSKIFNSGELIVDSNAALSQKNKWNDWTYEPQTQSAVNVSNEFRYNDRISHYTMRQQNESDTIHGLPYNNSQNLFLSSELTIIRDLNSNKKISKLKKALYIGVSTLVGIGTGVAMMPIFNREVRELEKFDINIHDNQIALIVSTVNTFLIGGWIGGRYMYKWFVSDNTHNINDNATKLKYYVAKIAAIASAVIPVSQLWNVELHDQQVAKSQGFDEFIMWATFSTLPLLIGKIATHLVNIEEYMFPKKLVLDTKSVGANIAIYGFTSLATLGYGLGVYGTFKDICENLDINEDGSITLSVIMTCIAGAFVANHGFKGLKELFDTECRSYSYKDYIKAFIAVTEGVWLSLPMISYAENVIENLSDIIKAFILFPFLLVETNLHSKLIIDTFETQQIQNELTGIHQTLLEGDNL